MKKLIALLLVVVMVCGLAACGKTNPETPAPSQSQTPGQSQTPDAPQTPENIAYVPKQAEYNTTTATMPSNWNEFTYADNNDIQILDYIRSSFYAYDYKFENDEKFNADGSVNKDAIVPGAYTTNYSAATKLEDVTSTVDAKRGYTDE